MNEERTKNDREANEKRTKNDREAIEKNTSHIVMKVMKVTNVIKGYRPHALPTPKRS